MSSGSANVRPVGSIDSFAERDLGCDGMYLGGDGNVYSAHSRPDQIPAFQPASGDTSGAHIVIVNGVLTTAEAEAQMCQSLADATGAHVVGLHNATTGDAIADGLQALGDKGARILHEMGIPYRNEATETMTTMIHDAIDRGEPINLVGHSQGGLLISSALNEVADGLRVKGESEHRMHEQLSLVHVQTLGAAAWSYPEGPDYYHHVNAADTVPGLTGLGTPDIPHILGDAILGQNVPESLRPVIGELLQELSGHPHNVVQDEGTRFHEFDHPEPWFNRDGQFDLQAHSAQLYFDELRQDPAALGAIATPERDDDRLGPPGPGHYLHGHATINDWSPMPETPTASYES